MTTIDRRLSIHIGVLAVLGTILLGLGQGNAALPLLIIAVVVLSIYFTDIKETFQINRFVANTAALVAMVVALREFATIDRNFQLLAIANLLVYLQVVVFFQKKNTRIYWQLIMLSLLQVVVAAALSYSVLFGILMLVYLFESIVMLSLFFVYRETERFGVAAHPRSGAFRPIRPTLADSALRRGTALQSGFQGSGSETLEMVASDKSMLRRCAQISFFTLMLTAMLFVIVPRLGPSPWRTGALQTRSTVGFSQEVTLGALGEVIENPEVVMRVQFIDQATEKPIQLRGEPLLRGSVVVKYTRNQWSRRENSRQTELMTLPKPPRGAQNLVRQKMTLEPLDEPVVFGVYPVYRLGRLSNVNYDKIRQQLVRREFVRDSQLNLELATTGIRDRRQFPYAPARLLLNFGRRKRHLQMREPVDGTDPLEGLRRVADQVIQDAQVPTDDKIQVARTLEAYLKTEGGFQYSLTGQDRDPELDSIEDFMVNNRIGHCEYFASALALMLRSQDIPSRVVIGYKEGEWNSLGQFYQFRQLHAHTWVEAYLPPDYVRTTDIQLSEGTDQGVWMRLDPTASDMAAIEDGGNGLFAKIGEMAGYVEMLWIEHVVGLTQQKQRSRIYEPVANLAKQLQVVALGDEENLSEWKAAFVSWERSAWDWLRGNWFSWSGGLVAMGFCMFVLGMAWVARFGWRKIRGFLRRRIQGAGWNESTQVPFYRRLEALLADHGHRRPGTQTQREFATSAGGQMAGTSHLREAAPLPRRVVDAFYQVRFGGQALDSQQTQAVEHALDELEASLSASVPGSNSDYGS